ncbi:MAG TPA: transposase [Mycobacterium sp.]|nr:transposase [Mycobacterium sp.]
MQRPVHHRRGRRHGHLSGSSHRAHWCSRHRSARFGQFCRSCPLRPDCRKARGGRVIVIHPHEAVLQQAKARQNDPSWQRAYRENRPDGERKISHLTRRCWAIEKLAAADLPVS